jgi:stage II sporulation protein GA (sporulation sigma-E factor processing peptidase)
MKIIYLDVLFIVNLIPDYLLLKLTGILWGRYPKRWRLFLGSFFAAATAIPLYFTPFGVYGSCAAKAIVCILVCLITFGKNNLGGVCSLFIGMSFAFAGAVSVLCWLGVSDGISVQGATVYANLSLPMLII